MRTLDLDLDFQISNRIMDYSTTATQENPNVLLEDLKKYQNIINDPFSNVAVKFDERKKEGDVTLLVHDFNYSKLMEDVNPNESIQVITCLWHTFIMFLNRFHPGYICLFINEDKQKNQFKILFGPEEDLNKVIFDGEDRLIGTF